MEQLLEAYKQNNLILFVGAGVSQNLGLPSWDQLMIEVARQLDYNPDVFSTYGEFLSLAEFYRIRKGNIGPLRSWMDRAWHTTDIPVESSPIHGLIAQGNFPLIYTTNYDRWIEKAFQHYLRPYTKVSKVSDLVDANSQATQIVKFHGDFDDDTSIVLSESSYFERLEFETPLDIKLRADALGKSVLFIGYSLSDINIRLLFYKLAKIWQSHGDASVRPKSYIFFHRPNPVQEEILAQWGIKMISSDRDEPGIALQEFMEKLVQE
ncbi:SIR2 family protein [Dongshaea marina]|uniref:SIR2 family protein n=1 Tax=Dongshaea marina TaxID=2047966 RepID=UPI000D3E6951|nr:SIR2 family protein [Dongshaea marina]